MNCPSCGEDTGSDSRFCIVCGIRLPVFCSACGAEVPDSARFCGACGEAVSVAPDQAAPTKSTQGSQPGSTAPTISSGHPPRATQVALPASFAGGRYQVRRLLGEGGRKRVYLAYDTALDREVALATVKTEGLDEGGLVRVRREAQAMGRLGGHPHIVSVYDIGDEGGRPFIVSQCMSGGSLEERLADAEDHLLPVPEAIRIGTEICEALEHAHRHGVVHRDLKPANVWLSEDGSARLGDFGLAVTVQQSRLTTEGMMVGTVAYMAPEQALGGEVDARADLYALGALLYEVLTGRPPFVGNDAVAVISQHLNAPPMAPWWHNAQIPRPLGELTLELLAKIPDERPASATEVRKRLAQILDAPTPAVDVGPTAGAKPRSGRLHPSRFVGREREIGILKAAVDAALGGRGGFVAIAGEAGIGKTRLTEEAALYARLRGAQVLVGHCYEAESSLPYIPFVEVIRQHVTPLPADRLRLELGDAASDVAKLVSEIRERLSDVPPGTRTNPDEERYHLFEGVSSFLVHASGTQPIVLVLDDLHWADTPSLLLLEHLARRVPDSRLLVVGTYRDAEVDRRHPLSAALAVVRREAAFDRITLRGMSFEEVEQLIEGVAERSSEPDDMAVIAALHRETEGNPFFVEEVLRHLLETGGASWSEGRWMIDPKAAQGLAIPDGVREIIGRRLSRLSEPCADLLTRAALLGRHFDFDVLAAMGELDEDALLQGIEEALRAQLIVEGDGKEARYGFTHALVRQTLLEELSLPRRRRLHRRAGEAIEKVYAGTLEHHLSALAVHHRMAGPAGDTGKAVDYSIRAGEAARRVFAYEEAAEHWEAAIGLLEQDGGDLAACARLLERLGDLKSTANLDPRGSIAALERALALYEQLGDAGRVAQMHSRMGRDLSNFPATADLPQARSHFEAAEAILRTAPESPALAYVYLGQAAVAFWSMRNDEGLAVTARALEVAEHLGNQRLAVTIAPLRANHLMASGRLDEAFGLVERTWTAADAADDLLTTLGASWIAAGWLADLGAPGEMKHWCQRELAAPRMAQAGIPRRILLDHLALALAQSGDLEEARGVAASAGTGAKYAEPFLALCSGEWDTATDRWAERRQEDRRRGVKRDEWNCTYWLGRLDLLRGDHSAAEGNFTDLLSSAVDAAQPAFELRAASALAITLADAGRPADAGEHLGRCRSIVTNGENWRGLVGTVALAEAAVAAAEGRVRDAVKHLEQAVEVFGTLSLVWDHADAVQRWGRLLAAVGEQRGAVERFGEALAIYRRAGAGHRWIEHTVGERLAAQGVPEDSLHSIDAVAVAVEAERPDLRSHAAPDGTVTILFTDIEGSTASNERLGDRRWLEVLRLHNRIVREQVAAHDGFEVKSQGDGFMVAFSSARRAINCAIAVQHALSAHAEEHPEEPIAVRIGLHTGEVVKEAEDFFGANVAFAARVAGAAEGGEILVSGLLKELVHSSGEFHFGAPREMALKGISGTRSLYEVLWQQGSDRRRSPSSN